MASTMRQGRTFRSGGHHEQLILGPDGSHVVDIPAELDLIADAIVLGQSLQIGAVGTVAVET